VQALQVELFSKGKVVALNNFPRLKKVSAKSGCFKDDVSSRTETTLPNPSARQGSFLDLQKSAMLK
jgi:hypothetical protein